MVPLTFELIDVMTLEEAKQAKLQLMEHISCAKSQIEELERDELAGDRMYRVRKRLRHLQRLLFRTDARIIATKPPKNSMSYEENESNRLRNQRLTEMLKPQVKHAIFAQVCYDLLDRNTIEMLQDEADLRLKRLKESV